MKNNRSRLIDCAYFCTTPYQLIASIIMAMSDENEKADLYIVKQYKGAEKYAERVGREGIFECVKVIDEKKLHRSQQVHGNLSVYASIVLDYFKVDKKAAEILIPDTLYKRVYISTKAYTSRLVQLYCEKHGLNTEFILYDDGVGSYINKEIGNPKLLDRIVRLIVFHKALGIQSDKRILYFPKLYEKIHPECDSNLISHIPTEKLFAYKPVINRVFGYKDELRMKETVIVLDHPREGLSEKQNDLLEDAYKAIIEYCGKNNVLFKLHPRDKRPQLKDRKYYNATSLPFEILCMNTNMEDKILVSMLSTAIIMPKLMFNQEPGVILLYKLVDGIRAEQAAINNIVNECGGLYAHLEKFLVPSSMQMIQNYFEERKVIVANEQ